MFLVSCKKEEATIPVANTPKEVVWCVKNGTHFFNGNYVSKSDTVKIQYLKSDCQNDNKQYYFVKGLPKSFASQNQIIEDKAYELISNEKNKAFDGGQVQIVYSKDTSYFLTLAMKEKSYTLSLKKTK